MITTRRALRARLAALTADRDRLARDHHDRTVDRDQAVAERDEAQRQLTDRAQELGEVRRKLAGLDLALATAEDRAAAAEKDRDVARAHAGEMDQQVATLRDERDAAVTQVTYWKNWAHAGDEARDALAAQVRDLEAERDSSRAEYRDAAAERDQVAAQVRDLQARLRPEGAPPAPAQVAPDGGTR